MSLSNWNVTVLGEVCSNIYDCEHKTAPTQESGYPSIRTPNIGKGRLILDGVKYVSEEVWTDWTKRAVPKHGDLIFAREAPLGNVALVPENIKLCLGQRTVLLRPNPLKVNSAFLCYLLLSPPIQHIMHSRGGGATVPHINIKEIKKLPLPIPTLPTQQKIANILSAYDDLIENNLKRTQLLEKMAQITYEEWFVHLRFPNHENVTINEETGLPEGWVSGLINQLVDFQNGYAFKSKGFSNHGFPVLKIKNIGNKTIDILDTDFVNKDVVAGLDRFKLQEGDLLIAMTGATIGKIGLLPYSEKTCYLNQRVGRFLPKHGKNNIPYIYQVVGSESGLNQIQNFASGASQPNISGVQILSLECVIPTSELLENFNQISKIYFEEILNLQKQNQNLKQARDILLPRLMTGMIDVDTYTPPIDMERMA